MEIGKLILGFTEEAIDTFGKIFAGTARDWRRPLREEIKRHVPEDKLKVGNEFRFELPSGLCTKKPGGDKQLRRLQKQGLRIVIVGRMNSELDIPVCDIDTCQESVTELPMTTAAPSISYPEHVTAKTAG